MAGTRFKVNYTLRFLFSYFCGTYFISTNLQRLFLHRGHVVFLLEIEKLISSFYEPSFFFKSCVYFDKCGSPYLSRYIFSCLCFCFVLYFWSTLFFTRLLFSLPFVFFRSQIITTITLLHGFSTNFLRCIIHHLGSPSHCRDETS